MFCDKDFMCAVTPQGRMRLSGAGRGRSGVGGGPVKARRRKMASNGPKAVRRRGSPLRVWKRSSRDAFSLVCVPKLERLACR
jgi:hypothetical protein